MAGLGTDVEDPLVALPAAEEVLDERAGGEAPSDLATAGCALKVVVGTAGLGAVGWEEVVAKGDVAAGCACCPAGGVCACCCCRLAASRFRATWAALRMALRGKPVASAAATKAGSGFPSLLRMADQMAFPRACLASALSTTFCWCLR